MPCSSTTTDRRGEQRVARPSPRRHPLLLLPPPPLLHCCLPMFLQPWAYLSAFPFHDLGDEWQLREQLAALRSSLCVAWHFCLGQRTICIRKYFHLRGLSYMVRKSWEALLVDEKV